jgi:hypothetical protein
MRAAPVGFADSSHVTGLLVSSGTSRRRACTVNSSAASTSSTTTNTGLATEARSISD